MVKPGYPLFTFDFAEGSTPVCVQDGIMLSSTLNRRIETFTTFEKSILTFIIQAA